MAGFTVEEGFGGIPEDCDTLVPLDPFTSGIVSIDIADGNSLRVERGGETWVFQKVDVAATVPRDDFVRGEWLLADRRGRPYRDEELTRVTFDGRGYRVDAPNCSFWSNGWFNDRDGQIRAGGNQYTQSLDCRPKTPGDRLAKSGDNARLIAEPVETRITVMIGNQRATLVPATRDPELATVAEAIAPAAASALILKVSPFSPNPIGAITGIMSDSLNTSKAWMFISTGSPTNPKSKTCSMLESGSFFDR